MNVEGTLPLNSKDSGTDAKHCMLKKNGQKAWETGADDARQNYHIGNLVQRALFTCSVD